MLGLYTIAGKMPNLANMVTQQPVASVSLPSLSLLQDDHAKMRRAVSQGMELNAIVSFAVFVGLAVVAPDLVPILFGAKWAGAGVLCSWLSLYSLLESLQVFSYPILLASGGIGKYVWLNVWHVLGVLVVCLVGIQFGVAYLVLGLIVNSMIIAVPVLLFLRQRIGLRPLSYCKPCLVPALASLLMVGMVLLMAALLPADSAPLLRLASKVFIGAAGYIGCILFLAPTTLKNLAGTVGMHFNARMCWLMSPPQYDQNNWPVKMLPPLNSRPPQVDPVPEGIHRPLWSVMIPAYNPRADYLEQALRSVLTQDAGPVEMQIEVVDDCSPKVDVAALVRKITADRVRVFRNPANEGLAGCWNTCIGRSRGQWVHILHQDDYVLPGFYQMLAKSAERHPEVSLLATRSFFVDGEGVIIGVTVRLPLLENGGRAVNDFFYCTPIQCSGVIVKRSCYEGHGGFRLDLLFTLDCEMWARAIGFAGGLITSEVLAGYRLSDINETARLTRTSEGLRDLERLNRLFSERYPELDSKIALRRICNMALVQADRYFEKGDFEAAKTNMDYWKMNAPASLRLRRFAGKIARRFFE